MNNIKIGIIGLGYVGLPLAVAFAKKYPVVGYDLKQSRIDELNTGTDSTLEIEDAELSEVLKTELKDKGLLCTSKLEYIKDCNYYIVTVPTPVDRYNHPDLTPLYKASETVGKVLKPNDIVIYESTVYPGVTEEECVPVLEKTSGLKFNTDFYCGYSPERINPGDKEHTVTKIKKVTSGSTPEIGIKVDNLYKSVIVAGTHLASSLKVAEASKVIENAQRDINIAFVNELARIFHLLNIDTNEVLEAAGTKWNFLKFKPGLVGGHCIGVDPFYLAQKAQAVGYQADIIFAGRRMNDGMGAYVANRIIQLMIKNDINVRNSKVLILGITFKENCPDIRNTKVVDIISHLNEFYTNISIYDPNANPAEVMHEYGFETLNKLSDKEKYDVIVLAVSHNEFLKIDYNRLKKSKNSVIFDIKCFLPKEIVNERL